MERLLTEAGAEFWFGTVKRMPRKFQSPLLRLFLHHSYFSSSLSLLSPPFRWSSSPIHLLTSPLLSDLFLCVDESS